MNHRTAPRLRAFASAASLVALAFVAAPASAGPPPEPEPQEFTRFTNHLWGGSCSHIIFCAHWEYSESGEDYNEMYAEVRLEAGSAQTGAEMDPSLGVSGNSFGSMDAVYRLTTPVASLTIRIVGWALPDASAELRDDGDATAAFRATATHAGCAGCVVSHQVVLADDEEELAPVEGCLADVPACVEDLFKVCTCDSVDEDIAITLEMTGPEGRVPAGDITIRALVEAAAAHLVGVPARASVFTQLDSVTVTPHPLEASD